MKKLMTMLGIITLTVTPVVTLVSCAPKDEHLDPDGNSIILDFGQKVGEDGITSLDSKAILDAIKNKPSFKNKFLKDVLSFVNSSFLENLDKFFKVDSEVENEFVSAQNQHFNFYDDSTYSTLENAWKNIQELVDRQIADEKEIMDDDKKWKESLVDKFPNFEDSSVEFLENKYRTSLLVDGEDNVESRIQQALIDNNHSGVTFVNEQKLNLIWIDHREKMKNPTTYRELITNKNNNLMRREFTQLYNSEFTSVEKMKSVTDINDEVEGFDLMLEQIQLNWNKDDTEREVNPVPDSIDSLSQQGRGINGILSNSQNYFLNNYYQTKAPVAISEVTFPYSSEAVFEQGITKDSINNYGGGKAATQINNFNDDAKEVNDDKSWIQLLSTDFDAKYGGTITKADKLMTIDDEQDPFLKSVVYDYLLNDGKNGLKTGSEAAARAEETTNVPWLEEINRSVDGTLYKILNPNLLVYLDASGVHFIHLHGDITNSQLKDEGKNYDKLQTFENNKISQNLYNQQADLNAFNQLDDQSKLAGVYEYKAGSKKNGELGQINNSIQNNYAKYLLNNSLTANITNSFSTYDLVGNMKTSSKSSSDDSIASKLILFDYFKNLKGIASDKTEYDSDKEFLNEFIKFENDDAGLENMVIRMIGTLRSGSKVTSAMAMEKQYNDLEKTIDAIKSNPVSGNKAPKAKFEGNIFNANILYGTILEHFKLFGDAESFEAYLDFMSVYALMGGN